MTTYEEVLSYERLRISRIIEVLFEDENEKTSILEGIYKMKLDQVKDLADDLSKSLTELTLSICRLKAQIKNV